MFGFLWWFSINLRENVLAQHFCCLRQVFNKNVELALKEISRRMEDLAQVNDQAWHLLSYMMLLGSLEVTCNNNQDFGSWKITMKKSHFHGMLSHAKLFFNLRYLYPKGRGTDWGLQPQSGEISETFGRRFFQPKHWQQWQVVVHGLDLGALVEDHKGGATFMFVGFLLALLGVGH